MSSQFEFTGSSPTNLPTPSKAAGSVYTRDGRDGFPVESEFESIIQEYVSGLNSKKREKALMTQTMYDNILRTLVDPDDTQNCSPQFRFWAKKMFRLVTTRHAHVITHENRPVAVREQIYDVLVQCHAQCSHGGRDKTSSQVRRYYSWIPKELVARFVKICPLCQSKRGTKANNGQFTYDTDSPPSYGPVFATPNRQGFYQSTTYSPSAYGHAPAVTGYAPMPMPDYSSLLLAEAANDIPRNLALDLNFPMIGQPAPMMQFQQGMYGLPQALMPDQSTYYEMDLNIDPALQSFGAAPVTPPQQSTSTDSQGPVSPSALGPMPEYVITPRTQQMINGWCSTLGSPSLLPPMPDSQLPMQATQHDGRHRGSVDSNASTELEFECDRPSSSYSNSPEAFTPQTSVKGFAARAYKGVQKSIVESEPELTMEDLNMDNLPSLDPAGSENLAGMALMRNIIDTTPPVESKSSEATGVAAQQQSLGKRCELERSAQPLQKKKHKQDDAFNDGSEEAMEANMEQTLAHFLEEQAEVAHRSNIVTAAAVKPKPPPLNLDLQGPLAFLDPNAYLADPSSGAHMSGARSAPAHVTQFLHPTIPLVSPGLSTPGSEYSSYSQPVMEAVPCFQPMPSNLQYCSLPAPPIFHLSTPNSAPILPTYASEPYFSMNGSVANFGHAAGSGHREVFVPPPPTLIPAMQNSPFFPAPLSTQQQQQASRDLSETIQQLLDNVTPNPGATPEEGKASSPVRANSSSPYRKGSR